MKPILIVKVGTSTLLSHNEAPSATFELVAASIRALTDSYRIVLVTSGAIGFGVRHLSLSERPQDIPSLQALSMLGQVGLMDRWRVAFGDLPIGQVLITRHELSHASDLRLLQRSIEAVWQYGGLPIVNENDAVATEEISFGDNDRLAAEVALHLDAQALVLLTDQDGIRADFGTPDEKRLSQVTLAEASRHIVTTQSTVSRGGAASKLVAAELALGAGVQVYIAHAATEHSVGAALAGKIGTKIIQ